MSTDVYHRLALFLDELPAGYPATEDGLHLKILKRLFNPEEAELALHLSLIAESPRVIAHRAGKPVDHVAKRLAAMERKGLIFASHREGQEPRYLATHFAVGIFEFQLHKMDAEIAGYFRRYFPQILEPETWKAAPQLRTVPVGESIDLELSAMDYERAENLVRRQERISVATCICRQESELLGDPCDKPMEVCLSFGNGADFYVRNEMGRYISQEEALAVLGRAEASGLVLQPDAAQDASFICCCCGCCCELLTNLKAQPRPAEIAHSAFVALQQDELCDGCGLCQDRCQMEALFLDGAGVMQVDDYRCIGCGLCVTECPNEALSLQRKPEDYPRPLPKSSTEKYIRLGKARGVLSNRRMASIFLRSKRDRLLAERGE